MTVDGNHSCIMEVFYVMKEIFIQEVGLSDAPEEIASSQMSFYIPESFVPALIGKSGNAIENLRRIIYAKLTIFDDDKLISGKTRIVLEGDAFGIPQAFSLLMSRILTLNPSFAWPYQDAARMSSITDSVISADRMKKSDFYTRSLMMALNPNVFSVSVSDRDSLNK